MAPLAIVALALAVRLTFLLAYPRPLASDARDYDALAWTLATTGHYAAADGTPTAYRAPGYPAFLAAIYAAAGRHPEAVKAMQAALDALTALLLYVLLSRRSRAAAVFAGLAWAALPAAVLFSGQLFSETAFTFGVVALAWLLSLDRAWTDALAGLVLGALILTKPMMLLFAAALPFALVNRASARPTTTILGIAIVPVLAWVARNLLVLGTPALITGAGTNLWIGNNPKANGGYAEPAPHEAPAAIGELENDHIAGSEALAYIASNPGAAAFLGARKLALLASSEAELTAGTFTHSDTGARLRERYRAVPSWLRAVVNMPTLVILILGVFGFAAGRGIERRIFLALLYAIAGSSLVFFGGSRFRFPLMPFLVLFAAEFVAGATRRLGEAPRARLIVAAAACCAIAAIWILEALALSAQLV